MAKEKNRTHVLLLINNVLAAILLAALTALGVYVNIKNIIVADIATTGYPVANLDTTSWNVACTVVGTAVGLLAAVAFANQ